MNRRTFLAGLFASTAVGCQSSTSSTQTGTRHLRVLSYNLHHGEGLDGRVDLERISRAIRNAKADFVALQEVDRKAERTGDVDQASEYVRLTQMHGWYGAAMPFQGGEYGQVILSRWPLIEPRVVRLPGTKGREPRIATTALVDVPGFGRVRFVCLHLDATREDADRWEQAGALLKEFPSNGIPTLLAGDFNATPESRVMNRMLSSETGWADTAGANAALTNPADVPKVRIDYVLAAPRGKWRVLKSTVIPEAVASDHRPLLVVLGY
ncbi:MAG: endonuclease [Pedosphaera sp.]|nr:endonuclease [Pedosphaera sp.]